MYFCSASSACCTQERRQLDVRSRLSKARVETQPAERFCQCSDDPMHSRAKRWLSSAEQGIEPAAEQR